MSSGKVTLIKGVGGQGGANLAGYLLEKNQEFIPLLWKFDKFNKFFGYNSTTTIGMHKKIWLMFESSILFSM